jgi:Toxin SymE, type I toxin-antitoxin system
MTPKMFVSDLLERPLTEAQPQTIKVGRTFQGNSSVPSRVPFIRLAGNWLAEARFSEGDEVQVSVARGEIRLRRQDSSRGSEESRRLDNIAARWALEESGHTHGGGFARLMVTPRAFWTFLASFRRTYPHEFNRAIRMI